MARLKAEINNGTSTGIIAFARLTRFPFSKSAPLAICAFIILSVSSIRIGINLKAIVIIIAKSWTGTFITFKNPRLFSSPSVRLFGVVVSVISDEPIIRYISLITINTA